MRDNWKMLPDREAVLSKAATASASNILIFVLAAEQRSEDTLHMRRCSSGDVCTAEHVIGRCHCAAAFHGSSHCSQSQAYLGLLMCLVRVRATVRA